MTTSYSFITPTINRAYTMDQSFLCYQMVKRSRLVIKEVDVVSFSSFFLFVLVLSELFG